LDGAHHHQDGWTIRPSLSEGTKGNGIDINSDPAAIAFGPAVLKRANSGFHPMAKSKRFKGK
jgi:hypothetical protein